MGRVDQEKCEDTMAQKSEEKEITLAVKWIKKRIFDKFRE